MKLFAAAATLFFVSLAAHAADTFERSLNVSSQPDLYISDASGRIHVFQGDANRIRIVAHVHAHEGWSGHKSGDIEDRIRRIVANPPIAQNGNATHVGEPPDRSLYNDISIDYDVAVPHDVALNLRTGSGDVQVDGVGRFLAAYSGSGSVRAHQLHGAADLQSGSGDLELEQTAAGDVKAQTGSGSVRIHGLNGGIVARSGSGDVECDGHLAGISRLLSGSGSVRLHFTPDSRFQLNATTGSGTIRVHMPGGQDTDSSRHHVTATINGGGPSLLVESGSGDIEVTPR